MSRLRSTLYPGRLFDRETQVMAHFVAYYPDVIVQGAWILAYFSAFNDSIGPLAARVGLINVQPDEWYPQQPFLDALKLACGIDAPSLFQYGLRAGDRIRFDEEPHSVVAALSLLESRHQWHHRNDDRSHWRVTVDSYHLITCVSSTPYPSDFERGLMTALVMRFRSIAGTCRIWHDRNEPSRKDGADSCTYRILWSEEQPLEASREAARSATV